MFKSAPTMYNYIRVVKNLWQNKSFVQKLSFFTNA